MKSFQLHFFLDFLTPSLIRAKASKSTELVKRPCNMNIRVVLTTTTRWYLQAGRLEMRKEFQGPLVLFVLANMHMKIQHHRRLFWETLHLHLHIPGFAFQQLGKSSKLVALGIVQNQYVTSEPQALCYTKKSQRSGVHQLVLCMHVVCQVTQLAWMYQAHACASLHLPQRMRHCVRNKKLMVAQKLDCIHHILSFFQRQ